MEKQKVVLIGAGSHAKVVADAIKASGKDQILGVVDPGVKPGEGWWSGIQGLPDVDSSEFARYECKRFVICVGDNVKRSRIVDRILERFSDAEFPVVIHPFTSVAPSATLGQGTVLFAGAVVCADAQLGEFCIVNTRATVEHETVVGDFVHVIAGVVMGGKVRIGDFSAIALGAILFRGISIGSHTVIGAGSVVTGNIPDGVIAFGSPCKVIRERSKEEAYL